MASPITSTIPKTKLIRGKACRNCTGPVPKSSNPANTKKREFCSDNCRKEFHKNNGISVHRLKDQVRKWVRDELSAFFRQRSEDEAAADLANASGVHVYDMEKIRKAASE